MVPAGGVIIPIDVEEKGDGDHDFHDAGGNEVGHASIMMMVMFFAQNF